MRLHLHSTATPKSGRRFLFRMLAVAFLVALAWFGWQAYHVFGALHDISGRTAPRTSDDPVVSVPPLNGNHRINFLVLGSDNDKKKEEVHPLTQTMIVVSVDPVHYKVAMLSIPRDFWVPIKGHGMGKIDLAHKYGGVTLARATVYRLFHIPIHYYAWVGLEGFQKVLDTFGGVSLDVGHPILDDSYPNDLNSQDPYSYKRVFLPAGWQHLSGTQALEYVRSRHGDSLADFGRSTRQQEILTRLEQKINALNVLSNLPQLADDLHSSIRTDLGALQLLQLGQLSRHIHPTDVTHLVLQAPTYSHYDTKAGQSVVIPDWQKIRPAIRRFFAPVQDSQSTVSRTAGKAPNGPPPTPAAVKHDTPSGPRAVLPNGLPANLFVVHDGNVFELLKTGGTRQLTNTGHDAMPSPQPDGRILAYVHFSKFDTVSDLWLLDLKSGRRWPLTHDTNTEIRNNLWALWPAWLDHNTLLFSWDRAKLAVPPSDARPVDVALWQMPTNRVSPVQLTTPFKGAGGDTEAAPRPGTRQIVYAKWNYSPQSDQPHSQLVLLTGIKEQALTPVGLRVLDPAWDTAGKRLAYVSREKGGTDSITVSSVVQAGSGAQLKGDTVLARGKVAQPAFTPDGKWISYLQSTGDGFSLYLVRSTGGTPVQLSEVGNNLEARWKPVWVP